jgi:hypothetical protein
MEQKKLWFRAKMYGWGWYPISWQGWVVLLIYVVAMIKIVTSLAPQHSGSDALFALAIRVVPLTILLLIICYAKGERPRWHWGK